MRIRGGARWAAVAGAVAWGSAACSSHGTVGVAAAAASGATAASPAASANPSTAPAATSAAPGADTGTAAPAGGSKDPAAAGLTPPGTRVRQGRSATVGWVPPAEVGTGPQQGYKLEVAVESIEKGTAGDLRNIQLDPGRQGSTPYYVKVRIQALDAVPSLDDNPELSFDAIDDRGQQQSAVIFLGTFDRCPDTTQPKPFPAGRSFESCMTYLMPGGGSIQKVQWGSGPTTSDEDVTPYFDNPVVWQ